MHTGDTGAAKPKALRLTLAAMALTATAAIGFAVAPSAQADDAPSPAPAAAPPAAPPPSGLTPDQRKKADEIISAFENGTTTLQYDYAENLNDGRGVTAGRAGFTTFDGDALKVIQAYTDKVPNNPLAKFIPTLQQLSNGNADTSGLPEADYIAAWKSAATDQTFRDVQDQQVNERYYNPAMTDAAQEGLTTPLALTELYDASVQHGNGNEADALPALIARTDAKGFVKDIGEQKWLNNFFDVRVADLQNPSNSATKNEWSKSVDRVEALRRLATANNYNLDGSFTITAFGSNYTIS